MVVNLHLLAIDLVKDLTIRHHFFNYYPDFDLVTQPAQLILVN